MTQTRRPNPLGSLLLDREGPLTRELARAKARFGLGQLPEKQTPDRTTSMICGFCATGCSLEVHLKQNEAVNLTPTVDYPVNLGMACPKGWEALAPLSAPDRLTTPMRRNERGKLVPCDWPTAIGIFVDRMKATLAKHGPESAAFLGTGQITVEELAILGAFGKFGMGLVHGDGNTRQCMATAVAAYKQSFGFDAPPYTYADFEASDVLVFVGANPCIAHPILWERVRRNPHHPTIVVVDPRRTETAMAATMHLAPQPKTDLALLYALGHVLVREGWIDRGYVDAHTVGFEEYAKHVARFSPESVSATTGIPAGTIERLARILHEGKRVSFWWTMGVNQSHQGTRTAQAIIDLALLTGNIGRPGTGANSITGQCNAMGSRLFSNTTNLLGGHDFQNAEHRAKVASILGIDVERIPDRPSATYDQILERIHRGSMKALWIVATNTAHSWVNQRDARALLDSLDFLVVQDMYSTTETAAHADLLLPAAGWGEKEGTFINSERRIGLVKRVAKAPGQALADFHIVKLLADAWGCGSMFARWESPEATFRLLTELSRGQPCDITGIDGYATLDAANGVQWPCPEGREIRKDDERRLFGDGRFFHPDGKARFLVEEPLPIPEATSEAYPFLLLTGRGSSSQWHTLTRSSKSPLLAGLSPSQAYVELHPDDAATLGIGPGVWVRLRSQRGSMKAMAHVTTVVRPGQVFVPMHYAETNRLTFPAFDPHSRQPAYKAAAVAIERLGPADTEA
ncbi:MAG: nitrate reductase [Polyangiales bacterium]